MPFLVFDTQFLVFDTKFLVLMQNSSFFKVYDFTAYCDYHPGGAQVLEEAAGKDCTLLFEQYHRWINGDALLERCLLGVVLGEELDGCAFTCINHIINRHKIDLI